MKTSLPFPPSGMKLCLSIACGTMKFLHLLSFLLRIALCGAVLSSAWAQVPLSRSQSHKTFPFIQWKYGWQDGMRANTIGSAKNGDPLPLGTSYLDTGYSPKQISNAYGFDLISTNGDGTGETIAIIVAYGSSNIQSDLDVFCTTFKLPKTTLQIYYPNGQPTNSDSGWASETALDVEWAHAMAPGATIALVVDADGNYTDQAVEYAVTNLNAGIISMSYGSSEYSGETSEDSFFTNEGVEYVAAAGDNRDGYATKATE